MAINKKITELSTKILDPDDIFIIADSSNNYQITMADISGALVGSGPPAGESTYSYFSEFTNNVGSVTIKEYDAVGNILQKVISDDFSDFKAYLNWDGPGAIDYRGTGYIEDQEILIANTQETVVGSRNFAGFVDSLDVSTNTPLQLSGRANGQISILNLELAGPAPLPETVRIQAIDQSSSANKIDIYPGDTIHSDTITKNDFIYKHNEGKIVTLCSHKCKERPNTRSHGFITKEMTENSKYGDILLNSLIHNSFMVFRVYPTLKDPPCHAYQELDQGSLNEQVYETQNSTR